MMQACISLLDDAFGVIAASSVVSSEQLGETS